MTQRTRLSRRARRVGFFVAVAAAIWMLFAGPELRQSSVPTASPSLRELGGSRLISIEPLPEMAMDGDMCQWIPASSPERLVAMRQEERRLTARAAAGAPAAAADVRPATILERAPLRVISDPNPTYSAVAIDLANNEIVLQDENLFQILAYDRTTNTPPSAKMSEPKRIIGGHHTKIEFNCGLYIDPKTGDIYSVNNDTIDTLTIFSRNARGDVPPDRELHTPHRTYGIDVDEAAQELFLTVQHPPEVVVYHKMAKGDDKPLRSLHGNRTQLEDPHGLTLDTKNGWIFVANYGNASSYEAEKREGARRPEVAPGSGRYEPPSITVYPIKADGDTAPIRVIEGPKTQMNWPAHIFVDEKNGELYIANDAGHSVLVFDVTANGDVAPKRVLTGPKTLIKNPTGVFVDTVNEELVVSNMGNHAATVYPRTAQGDTAPIRVIRGGPLNEPALQIGNPGAVAYDSKRDEILVPN